LTMLPPVNLTGRGGDENAGFVSSVARGALEPGYAGRVKQRLRRWATGICCVKGIILIALLLGAIGAAAQESAGPAAKQRHSGTQMPLRLVPARLPRAPRPPQPMAIPEQYGAPQEAYAGFPERSSAATTAPSACQLRLEKIATFKPLPVLAGPGECGATDAVLMDSVLLTDQTAIPLNPPATLRCTMAGAVANWVREDVAPATLKLGSPLRGVDNFNSYECRGRNRVRGATLSEHGRANALDVRGFRLANGEIVGLIDVNANKEWREAIRASACARFSTVLGPGSDGNHENHIHLDLAERRGDYKTCEWDVREPVKQAEKSELSAESGNGAKLEEIPLPRPRPVANAADDAQVRGKRPRSQLR
jgi:hypothetical protein